MRKDGNLDVVTFEYGDEKDPAPAWMRTALHQPETDAVLLPVAALGMSDYAGLMMAAWDGVSVATWKRHVYADSRWGKFHEKPDMSSAVASMEQKVRVS